MCREIGKAVGEGIAAQPSPKPEASNKRRGFVIGLAAIVGGAAVGGPMLAGLFFEENAGPGPCQLRPRKIIRPNQPEPIEIMAPGEMGPPGSLHPPPPPPEPYPYDMIDGEMPVEIEVEGDMIEEW